MAEPKTLKGAIHYEIAIVDGNINLNFQDSNENRLIAFEVCRKALQMQLDKKYLTKHTKKEVKPLEDAIKLLGEFISALGMFVIEKYKDAVPEEKKVKLINYDPVKHKLPNLKK